ncbi:hypothetical protein K432DRAFT_384909 [Lepidopterella palustris CBS 459.81]|uniref:Uncharacterized protein n=1 Tax=Lepidopterella palustris CBS 459.81 TaxID=1314670 RepID=A0A8E2E4H2_9PEZI|nr:hypothetical protein K432DRAFT_384909 [Lepidopterella palustris CBS 459.81]
MIHEPTPASTGARDWGMLLHWATPYLLSVLPLELRRRIKEPRVYLFYNWKELVVRMDGKTGEVLRKVLPPGGEIMVKVSWRGLRDFLAEGIDVQVGWKWRNQRIWAS